MNDDGPPEVMSPSITDAVHGTDDELIRARTVTMAQGPGFQLRQASEVVMDESMARALQELLSPQRDTTGLRSDLEQLAAEFVRVTNLLGGAVNTIAQAAQTQEQRIEHTLHEWSTDFERRAKETLDTSISNSTRQAM